MPKKEYYTAAEYYPKGTEKYDDIMHDAKAEAECPTNRKVNMKPVVYNDKGYETTNFGLGMMDYEKSHKTNENNQYTNMNKKLIRLTETDLHRIVKESVEKILMESDPDLYDALARPDGKLDMSNPYTWAKSPKMLKDMGYDENGMKRGKKYYDHLLNPNWRFNKRSAGTDFALNEPMGDQKDIRADIANMEKRQNDADARWQSAADTRPLHRKGSLNREF